MTALLMANYGMWISCLMSIDVNMNDNGTSMWVAIDRGVYLLLITVSLFIAAKREEAVKNFQAALALCTTLVLALLDFIQTLLLTEYLGCEMLSKSMNVLTMSVAPTSAYTRRLKP